MPAIRDQWQDESAAPPTATAGYKLLLMCTAVGAGGGGLLVFNPWTLEAIGGFDAEVKQITEHDVYYRIVASYWCGFGLVSTLAFLSPDPRKFAGVSVLQMVYNSIWILTTILPNLTEMSLMNKLTALIMAAYVAMDVLFIPWGYLFTAPAANANAAKGKKP